MRVADYVFKSLADWGVKHVFLVTGGGAMFLNNGLLQEKRITPICCHNESGAAIAAEGNCRVTEKLAVVSVTTGPGGTNAMTGLIGEWLDSQPVLYISGQVKFPTTTASCPELPLRQLGDQEINIVDIVKPVTKYAVMVTDPQQIGYELAKAVYTATHGRKGPVWLDIPINVQSAEIDPENLPQFEEPANNAPSLSTADLEQVVVSLKRAKSPVIIAGQGIRLAGAHREFLQLAERLQVPVLATFEGFDMMPTANPLMIGRIGTIGTRSGNIALQNADWVLCLGSRNNIRQISYNYENFAAKAQDFICVDIDRSELDKPTIHPTLKIQVDALDFLISLYQATAEWSSIPEHQKWLQWCQVRTKRYATRRETNFTTASSLDPYAFTAALTAYLPEQSIVACTNATPSLALFQSGIVKANQRMICNSGCAAMGYGLPCAVGVAAAVQNTGRDVVCLEGDGSLMMNIQEMQTVKTNRLPIKMFLYNNNEYCSIRQTHDNFFHERIGCDNASGVEFPDWQKIAAAFGWKYYVMDSEEAVGTLLPQIFAEPEAAFVDVRITPGCTFAPKLSSRRLPDGTLISPSLEDMFPFLSREEMQDNVYLQ